MNTKMMLLTGMTLFLVSCGGKMTIPTSPQGGQTICTQDAKQCPDGTWIGRSGPRCEFVCP